MCVRGDETPRPKQDEAVRLVWDFYGETKDPPRIGWMPATCGDSPPYGFESWIKYKDKNGVEITETDCYHGLYFHTVDECRWIQLADRENMRTSAVAHELMHAHLDGDPLHKSSEWNLVPLAEQALFDLNY